MEKWTKEERKAIGNRLKQMRKEKGFVQEDLANILGLKVGTISKYEQGERTPGIRQLAILADFLGCGISELITGEKTDLPKSMHEADIAENAATETSVQADTKTPNTSQTESVPQTEDSPQIENTPQIEKTPEIPLPVTVEPEPVPQTDFEAFLHWLNLSSIKVTLEDDAYFLQIGSKSFHLTEQEFSRIMVHLKKQFLKILLEITVKKA